MLKKRRHKRISLQDMDIQAKTVVSSECRILNMGLQGVCLATTQWLPINNDYSLKFNLDGKLVSHKGTVRWVKLVGNKKGEKQDSVPVYLTGIEFKSVLTDKGRDIIHVLDEYSTKGEKRLSGNRFNINAPGKAVFNILHKYPIRQISSGGMLVETDLALHLEKTFPWTFSFPGDDRIIQCNGKVVSRLETFNKNKRRYDIGVAFTDMQQENRIHLTRFIMKAMFHGLKTATLN
jgi:hypothetical protein